MKDLIKGAALFIGGAMVGAAAALLMAPKKGEELRQDLVDLAEEAKKRAQDYCEQVKQNLAEMNAAAEKPAPAKKPQTKRQKKEA
jgi:gas vesicle protein